MRGPFEEWVIIQEFLQFNTCSNDEITLVTITESFQLFLLLFLQYLLQVNHPLKERNNYTLLL